MVVGLSSLVALYASKYMPSNGRKLSNSAGRGQIWCPQIRQPLSAVFILASGRSGSTSVLYMINQIPGFYLRGENGGALYRKLNSTVSDLIGSGEGKPKVMETKSAAWLHPDHLNKQCMITSMKDLVVGFLNPPLDASTVGFKELAGSILDWHGDLVGPDMMAELFPDANFILNYRRNESAWFDSGFWTRKKRDQYKRTVDGMLSFRERIGDARTFVLHTEDMTVDRFNEMLTWLGIQNCEYNAVLRLNEGGTMTSMERAGKINQKKEVIDCH